MSHAFNPDLIEKQAEELLKQNKTIKNRTYMREYMRKKRQETVGYSRGPYKEKVFVKEN